MATRITVGEGGYDPAKPNNNIIATEEIPDEEIVPSEIDELRAQLVAALELIAGV